MSIQNRAPRISLAATHQAWRAADTGTAAELVPSTGASAKRGPEPLTSVTPPPKGSRIVARERLLGQLLEARRKRCIALQGPVGSGKTSVLLAWREALLLLGFDVAWRTLANDDNDTAHYLDHLMASLAQVDPAITCEASLLAGRGIDEEAIERIVISLVHGIASHQGDIALVLDDLHRLDTPSTHEALQWLLDFAPPNLHIVLVSRSSIPLSLGRLRDQGLVLELDMRDLRFSATESEEFLRAQLGEISARDARRLHELTDGWVAGLQLFAIRLKRKAQDKTGTAPTETLKRTYLLDPRAFTDYFEREVLSQLSASEVELLTRMSTCSRLCASLCIALIDGVQSHAEVLSLLAKLESDNLFFTPVASTGGQAWYSLNPLFRETLLERFRARPADHQRDVHRAAWRWFSEDGQLDDAVRHALLANETAAAIELVHKAARTLRVQGDLRKLVGLMRLLPKEEVQERVDLRLRMATLHFYSRELDAFAKDLQGLLADIPATDIGPRYQLAILQAALAIQRDDANTVHALLPQLMHAPEEADGLQIGGRNNALSWLHMHLGDYAQARRIQAEWPRPLVDGVELIGTSCGVLNGRCLAGFSYAIEGKFTQAERICRDVLFEANHSGYAMSEPACLAMALLGEVLYESNELDAARKLLEDRVDMLERVSIPDSVLRLFTVLSAVHWASGNRQQSFAYLKRLESYAAQQNLGRLMAHSVAEQVHRHLSCEQWDAARAGLARLDELVSHAIAAQSVSSADIQVAAGRAHINWCMRRDDREGATTRLTALIALCETRGWQRQLAHFKLQAALLDHRSGHIEAARRSVLDILRQGSRLGLVRTLLDAAPDALDLITEVMQDEPHNPVLSFYLSRLLASQLSPAGATAQSARSSATASTETLSERESRVVDLLARALPNKKIARTLGISPETVKWHLKNIYGKLGVTSRDEAVARVRDINFGTDTTAGTPDVPG